MVSPAITIVRNENLINDYNFYFKDAIGSFENPKIYEINVETYKDAINSVFFPPTNFNMRFYNKYNDVINELYKKWWSKIETSKKIAQNKEILDKYRENLNPGDVVLLGTITEGGQGLATANNGKFVGVRIGTKQATSIIQSRPKKLFKAIIEKKIPLPIKNIKEAEGFLNEKSEIEIRNFFDDLKEKYGRDIFGQGYIFKIISEDEIADINTLTDDEKKNGINKNKSYFVPYDKGDRDGNRWYLKTPFLIDWSKESVDWLKNDPKARWQGYEFYFREGFCWTDVHTIYIKARFKEKGVHDVKSMSLFGLIDLIPEYYIISIMNSKFISEYVSDFVNNTQTFQINDARQLPIIIPNKEELKEFEIIFDNALSIKKKQFSGEISNDDAKRQLNEIQEKLDELVYELYELTPEEIKIIE